MSYSWLVGKAEANQLAAILDIYDQVTGMGWTEADGSPRKTCAYTDVDTGADTITINSHGFANGQQVFLHTTGTAPGNLTNHTAYYVVGGAANTFQLSASVNGAAIDLVSQGTGNHSFITWATLVGQAIAAASVDAVNNLFTLAAHGFINGMLVTYTTSGTVAAPLAQTALTASANINTGTDTITLNAHGFVNGQMVLYSPTAWSNRAYGLVAGKAYFIINTAANTFQLSLTSGGAAVDITSQGSGNHSFAPLYFIVGVTGTTFQLSYTQGGAAIDITSAGTGNHSFGGVEKTNSWIVCYNHGLVDGQPFQIMSTGTLPTGFTAYTFYYIQNVQTHSFQLSTNITGWLSYATIANGGTGGTYAVNDVLTLVQFGGATGSLKVIGVSAGVVTEVALNAAGSAYTQALAVPVTGGGGTGATFNIFCFGPAAISTIGTGTHTISEPFRAFTSTGELGDMMTRHIQFYRSTATALALMIGDYWDPQAHRGLGRAGYAGSATTSEAGFYIWIYGNKNMVFVFSKTGASTYTVLAAGHLKKIFGLQTTLTADAVAGASVQLSVADNTGFVNGKKYLICGINTGPAFEGRDGLTLNALPVGKLQVVTLPRNYKSGAVIGQTPSCFVMSQSNTWYGTDSFGVAGSVDTGGGSTPAGTPTAPASTVSPADIHAEQRLLLAPWTWFGGDSGGGGIAGYMDEYFLLAPTTVAAVEDTMGVNPNDLTGAGVYSGTSTGGNDSTHFNDTGKAWSVNAFSGKVLIIATGVGAGQMRKISTNSATQIIPVTAFTTIPDNTSTYAVCDEGYRYMIASLLVPAGWAFREEV
jgi:hypothetical protein